MNVHCGQHISRILDTPTRTVAVSSREILFSERPSEACSSNLKPFTDFLTTSTKIWNYGKRQSCDIRVGTADSAAKLCQKKGKAVELIQATPEAKERLVLYNYKVSNWWWPSSGSPLVSTDCFLSQECG